jgi:hypothetical protein
MYPRFSSADSGPNRLLIRGYINQQCGETPTDLRAGMPMPTRNLAGLRVTHTETQRKAAINPRFSPVAIPVTWRIGLRRNLSAFSCLALRLIRTTQLSGLLYSSLNT